MEIRGTIVEENASKRAAKLNAISALGRMQYAPTVFQDVDNTGLLVIVTVPELTFTDCGFEQIVGRNLLLGTPLGGHLSPASADGAAADGPSRMA